MTAISFELEDDPTPVVLGVRATLRRAAARPKLARRMAKMKGVLALRSTTDKQAATLRFDRGRVRIENGVAADAGVVISLDLGARGPDAAKPSVKGALRHPMLALGAAQVLDPEPGSWREEAEAFWAFAKDAPRMPSSLLVVCTDEGAEARFGDGTSPIEIHGSAETLRAAFSGSSVVLEEAMAGRIQVVGTIEQLSVFTGRAIAWSLGEGR